MENIDLSKKVLVENRAAGEISYVIDALRVRRSFPTTGHRMEITLEELQELTFIPGGRKLMEKYMLIRNQDACEFLGLPQDPEYFYDENDVRTLLTEGTEDQLQDCLDFAPSGVLDLVKKIAVELPLDSSSKRQVISNALGVNIDAMIKNEAAAKADNGEVTDNAPKQRRSAPINEKKEEEAPTSKYKVVNRG